MSTWPNFESETDAAFPWKVPQQKEGSKGGSQDAHHCRKTGKGAAPRVALSMYRFELSWYNIEIGRPGCSGGIIIILDVYLPSLSPVNQLGT